MGTGKRDLQRRECDVGTEWEWIVKIEKKTVGKLILRVKQKKNRKQESKDKDGHHWK